MKKFKLCLLKIMTLLVATAVVLPISSVQSFEYGPQSKRFGVGLYLGEPTGLTFKGYLTEYLALGGIISWSFGDESFAVVFDGTYEILQIPVKTSKLSLPFYAGAGTKIGFDQGGRHKDRTTVALRIPVGIAMQFVKHPVEIFFEVAPGMDVAPETKGDISGGIGARYYF